MRRRAKTDHNQPGIVKELRTHPGVTVLDMSRLGNGAPDIAVGYRGNTYFFEIKNRDGRGVNLTMEEGRFRDLWAGHYEVVEHASTILIDIGVVSQ